MLTRLRPVAGGLLLGPVLLAAVSGCGRQEAPAIASIRQTDPAGAVATPSSGAQVLDGYISSMNRFVTCLRNHGLTRIADPDRFGQVRIVMADVPNPEALRQARSACQSLSVPMPQAVRDLIARNDAHRMTPAEKATARRYADCMQANGAPDFPDPGPDGVDPDRSWDQSTPGARAALAKCGPIVGAPAVSGPGVG